MLNLIGNIKAQTCGIYLTSLDFDNNKLSYTKSNRTHYNFKANRLFNSNYIRIVAGDSIYNISKAIIYGYCDTDNSTYRIVDQKEYKILNTNDEILLYSITKIIDAKGNKLATNYFFSANSKAAIFPLTKINLKKAFDNSPYFHELIDMYFNSDSDLMAYDDYYKMYKINRIIEFYNFKNK